MEKQYRKTKQTLVNDSLSKSEAEYYAGLMASIRDAVISTDDKFMIKTWNRGAENIYGWAASEAIGKTIDELLSTVYETTNLDKLLSEFKLEGHFRSEVIQKTKSGKTINIHMSSSAIYDREHTLTGVVTVNKDITDRKKLERQLKKLNEKLGEQVRIKTKELTNIFERITDGFIALDNKWRYTYVNKKIGELTGLDPASLIGKNVWEVFPDAVGSATYDLFLKAMAEQKFMTNVDYYEPLDLWQENAVYPSREGISVFIRDISERKRAEEKIIKANRLYFFISQINQMIVRVKDEETLFKDACTIAINVGKFKMAWIGKLDNATNEIIPVMHCGENDEYLSMIKNISLNEDGEHIDETSEAIREGKYIICNDIPTEPGMRPWKDTSMNLGFKSSMTFPLKRFGKVVGVFAFYTTVKHFFDSQEIALLKEATGDVSFALENFAKEELRKKSEEAIHNSEEKTKLIMNAALDAIICMDIKGLITFWNPQAEKIFGWKEDEVIGKRLSEIIIPPAFRKMHEKGMKNYLETGHGPVLNVLLELKAIKRDKKEFPVELTVLPIKQAGEEFFCAFIRDVSHKREEEARIAKATIEAQENERHHIGQELHDNVNQILVGSLLNLAMIKQVSTEKINGFVEMSKEHILNAIDEIRKLSHQLAPASFDDISLQHAFESLLQSINTNNNFKIDIQFDDLDRENVNSAIQINLYRILQEQLNNIVKYSKADTIEVSVTVPGKYVRLRIFDNGIGFDPETIKKGIGLGNIKKRAELFSGTFTLNTSMNNGCEIIVEIPLDK